MDENDAQQFTPCERLLAWLMAGLLGWAAVTGVAMWIVEAVRADKALYTAA